MVFLLSAFIMSGLTKITSELLVIVLSKMDFDVAGPHLSDNSKLL